MDEKIEEKSNYAEQNNGKDIPNWVYWVMGIIIIVIIIIMIITSGECLYHVIINDSAKTYCNR